VLQLIGARLTPDAQAATPARSVLEDLPDTRVVPFSCYYDNAGRGFVTGHTKVIWVPETGQSFYYDLLADPNERDPKPLTTELRTTLDGVQQMIEAHRASKWLLTKDAFDTYPKWRCREGRPCAPVNPLKR
jgi:hypothetical protein